MESVSPCPRTAANTSSPSESGSPKSRAGQTLPLSHASRPVLTTVVVNRVPATQFPESGDVGLSSTIRILFMGGNVLRGITTM